MAEIEVFGMPSGWQFYQADLEFALDRHVTVAGEPHEATGSPVVTIDMQTKDGNAMMFLMVGEALEIWTALGHAIKNASGKDPAPVDLIETQ